MYLLVGLLGCLDVGGTPPVIEDVRTGPLDTTVLELTVVGRGFGLSAYALDLTEGGASRATALDVVLLDASLARATPGVLTSETEVRATFFLLDPLPAGPYGVELRAGERVLAEKNPAFSVP